MGEQIKQFVSRHWFQLAILVVVFFIAWIVYNALVIQPNQARREEAAMTIAAQLDAQTKESERQANLDQCLAESEYEKTSSHLWLCSSLERVPKSCGEVFGGASSIFEALGNYRAHFKTTASDEPTLFEKFDVYIETCNCGLEKYRRDEIDQEKSERDKLCLAKYGK